MFQRLSTFVIFISSFIWGDSHIFVLHRFNETQFTSTSISTNKLREDFQFLKDNGYKVVPLSQLLANSEKGKLISFTIDDGYKSFYEHGLKLFREFDYPFTLFIYIEAIEKNYPEYLSWSQVKHLSKFGEIAIHSYSHKHLTHLDPISIMRDTQFAIESYKTHLKEVPRYYSYPYGEYSYETNEVIGAFGFDAIFNQSTGAVSNETDLNFIYRTPIQNETDIKKTLGLKYLKTEWLEPLKYPEDDLLRKVTLRIPSGVKKAEIYVSGIGAWQPTRIKGDIAEIQFKQPIKLTKNLIRIFVKVDNRVGSTIIVK
jgi:peptidoglycan/xylan/chitin deacetylase (PgdA/CDA1 family)